jgi:hypothetical protein
MRSLRCVLVLGLMAAPVSALPEKLTRITISGVSGEPEHTVSRQLVGTLCGPYECVSRLKVYTKGLPDFRRLRAEGVTAVLYGSVLAKGGRRTVRIALLRDSLEPDRTWTFALDARGAIPRSSLDELVRDVRVELGAAPLPAPRTAAPAPAAPPPAAAPLPVAAPLPLAATAPSTPPPSARAVEAQPPPPQAAAEPPTPAPAAQSTRAPPASTPPPAKPSAAGSRRLVGASELGAIVTSRELTYSGSTPPGTADLLGYSANAIACPRIRLELYPLTAFTSGALAGVGFFGEYSLSVGLTTEDPASPGVEHDSRFSRLQAGIAWRIRPTSSSRFAIVPAVSYQRLEFSVDPTLAGFPDSDLSGVKAGLGLEIPLGGRLGLLLGGGYVMWTSAKDLVDGDVPFFPGAGAYALEAEAGLTVALGGRISLRVLGEYSATTYELDPDPSGTYVATGATDTYVGGRAMLRAEF